MSKLRTVKRSPKGTRAWLVGGMRIQRTLDPISFRNSNTVCFKTLTQVGTPLMIGRLSCRKWDWKILWTPLYRVDLGRVVAREREKYIYRTTPRSDKRDEMSNFKPFQRTTQKEVNISNDHIYCPVRFFTAYWKLMQSRLAVLWDRLWTFWRLPCQQEWKMET